MLDKLILMHYVLLWFNIKNITTSMTSLHLAMFQVLIQWKWGTVILVIALIQSSAEPVVYFGEPSSDMLHVKAWSQIYCGMYLLQLHFELNTLKIDVFQQPSRICLIWVNIKIRTWLFISCRTAIDKWIQQQLADFIHQQQSCSCENIHQLHHLTCINRHHAAAVERCIWVLPLWVIRCLTRYLVDEVFLFCMPVATGCTDQRVTLSKCLVSYQV
jgi:hypothetical protein